MIDKVILWKFGKKWSIKENSSELIKLRRALFNSSISILNCLTSKREIEPFKFNFSELRNESKVVEFVFKLPSYVKACWGNASEYVCYTINITEVSFVLKGKYEGYILGKRVDGRWIILNDKDKSWMGEMEKIVESGLSGD